MSLSMPATAKSCLRALIINPICFTTALIHNFSSRYFGRLKQQHHHIFQTASNLCKSSMNAGAMQAQANHKKIKRLNFKRIQLLCPNQFEHSSRANIINYPFAAQQARIHSFTS